MYSYEDVWNAIEVLKSEKSGWFWKKEKPEEKFKALEVIAKAGHANSIYSLLPFLKFNNEELRNAVCDTIITLFKKIDDRKGYYNTLKHCSISRKDLDYYETVFDKDRFFYLLALSSLNGNGYLRELAVLKLAQTGKSLAIPFTIYRLADWVLPVRQAALEGIKAFANKAYIDALIANLPAFEWLLQVQRTDLRSTYEDIITFLMNGNRDYILTNFRGYEDRLRFLLAKHISSALRSSRELQMLLEDRHFMIRKLTLDHFENLTDSQIECLLQDRSAGIRQETLYRLKENENFEAVLKRFIADDSATIRNYARYYLKHTDIDFAAFYHDKLKSEHQITGALMGIAEISAVAYRNDVLTYTEHHDLKIKKSAFNALCILDEEAAYEFGLKNMDTPFTGLRNQITNFLSGIPREEILIRARIIYNTGSDELKLSMLRLYGKTGGWKVLADLMSATTEQKREIRELANVYLQNWRTKAIHLYTNPTEAERNLMREVFARATAQHEQMNYFNNNPVHDLYFYFK